MKGGTTRAVSMFGLAILTLAAGSGGAQAVTYSSGDVLYVAYQSPTGPNYIVNLGPRSLFLTATSPLTLSTVKASDLDGLLGPTAPDILVGLFGVMNPGTRDGILSANGPITDLDLAGASVVGAVNQLDAFGGGVAGLSSPVPSGEPTAGSFSGAGSPGSYQSTLNAVNPGSLGNNIPWSVETRLSGGTGARNLAPVVIPFFKAIRNTFTGASFHQQIGSFTLSPDGTITYAPLKFVYTSGDVLYVAYQSPSGPNYIVNLGSRLQFVNATTTLTFPDVQAADLDAVMGPSAPNLLVGLFGVLNPGTRDGLVTANGPVSDAALSGSSILGAVNQTDAFGGGVVNLASKVPSGDPFAASFSSAASPGSYQSTLDAVNAGSLGNNLSWNVETQLSDGSGVRNGAAVLIPFYRAVRNAFTGAMSRAVIGFFRLNPNGTISYSPDADGDFIADELDLCPGLASSDNSDADGDHHAAPCDCNSADASAWSIPTEASGLLFTDQTAAFHWSAPSNPGGTAPRFDVVRAGLLSSGNGTAFACFQSDLVGTSSVDGTIPPLGTSFMYLVRAGNSCGEGLAGTRTGGAPIVVGPCP